MRPFFVAGALSTPHTKSTSCGEGERHPIGQPWFLRKRTLTQSTNLLPLHYLQPHSTPKSSLPPTRTMALPTRSEFYRDHLAPCRILPGAPKFADIGICVVCQEDFNDASYDMVAVKSCSHVFHRKCIIQWSETWGSPRDKCPSCRESMYQYTPMTAHEIQAMQEAQAIQDAESRLSELGPYAAAREAERLWFASMGVSSAGLDEFDDMTEPTHFSDEDGEEIATSLDMNVNPNLSLQVPTFADFGSASPAYSPTFPVYSDASLGESPTSPRYSPPSPRFPPTFPIYSQSTPLHSPTIPVYSAASQRESPTSPAYPPSTPYKTKGVNQTQSSRHNWSRCVASSTTSSR